MATATDTLVKVQDQILETLASIQKPVLEAVTKLADKAESVVPEVPSVPGADRLPTVDELIVNQFAFAEKVLTLQKDFTAELIKAVKPVSSKLVSVETKPKARTTKAA
jgi:hypothetical protein